MKNTIKNKIKKDSSFNKNQKKLAVKMIDMFNNQDTLQISQRELSKVLKVPRETVKRLILKLIKNNYLKILKQGNHSSSTIYKLSLTPERKIEILEELVEVQEEEITLLKKELQEKQILINKCITVLNKCKKLLKNYSK